MWGQHSAVPCLPGGDEGPWSGQAEAPAMWTGVENALASDSAGQFCLLPCHNLSLQQGSAGSAAWRSDLWREGGPSERLKGEPLRLIRVTPAPTRKPAASTKKGQCACVQGGAGSHLMSSETQSGGTEPPARPASSPAPLLSPAELLWASPVLEEVALG